MTESLLYIINAACFFMGIDSSDFFTTCFYSEFLSDSCNNGYDCSDNASGCSREHAYMAVYYLRKYFQCIKNSKIMIDSSSMYMSNEKMLLSHPSEKDAHNFAKEFTDIVLSWKNSAECSETDICSPEFFKPCKYDLCIHSYIDKLLEYSKNHRRHIALVFSDSTKDYYSFFYGRDMLMSIKKDCKRSENGVFSDSIKAFYAIYKKRVRCKKFDNSEFTEMIKVRIF